MIMPFLTAILTAAIPTAIYSLLLWWLDRYEKEPLPLIVAAFLWGAVPAIALAILIEMVVVMPLGQAFIGPDVSNWGLVPLVEELIKALALIGLFHWARREFDGPLDGIVYGALVGFGFSMTENALYFLSIGSIDAAFWLRGVLFGINHAFFTSLVGLAFGIIRHRRGPWRNGLVLAAGFALAVLFHATHNFFVSEAATVGVLLSWLVQVSGGSVILMVAALAWRTERQVMERELEDEVRAGVLTLDEYLEVTSSQKRLRRQGLALLTGGWVCWGHVRRLHHLATELAFCKARLRAADQLYSAVDHETLRQQIFALRSAMRRAATLVGEY